MTNNEALGAIGRSVVSLDMPYDGRTELVPCHAPVRSKATEISVWKSISSRTVLRATDIDICPGKTWLASYYTYRSSPNRSFNTSCPYMTRIIGDENWRYAKGGFWTTNSPPKRQSGIKDKYTLTLRVYIIHWESLPVFVGPWQVESGLF